MFIYKYGEFIGGEYIRSVDVDKNSVIVKLYANYVQHNRLDNGEWYRRYSLNKTLLWNTVFLAFFYYHKLLAGETADSRHLWRLFFWLLRNNYYFCGLRLIDNNLIITTQTDYGRE